MGQVFVIISRPAVGVLLLKNVNNLKELRWREVICFIAHCVSITFPHTKHPYESIGLAIPRQAHKASCGDIPQNFPIAEERQCNVYFTFFTFWLKW